MSDIRFNQWLHNSGTGGVSQVDGGHVGIGTTNPLIPVGSGNTAILNVGVVTANSFYGDGSNLSGVQVGGASSLSFNDNIGAYFGNSQDLKIYHDGNHSYIDDQGTGNLRLRSGTLEILNLAGNKTSATFSSGGGQTLNFNNSTKFVTTNTGIDVTGSVVADDLIVTGTSVVADLKSTNNNYVLGLAGNNSSNKAYFGTDSSGNFLLATGSGVVERLRIEATGNTDVKKGLRVSGEDAAWTSGSEGAFMDYYASGSMVRLGHVNGASGSAKSIVIYTGGSEKLRIGSDGVATLKNKLIIDDGSNGHLFLNNTSSENTIHSGTTGFAAYKNLVINAGQHIFKVSNTERFRIHSTGRVKIGNSGGTPDGKLHIDEIGTGDIVAELTANSPMFTYRNGSGSWFHAGKHPSDDAFVVTTGGTTTSSEKFRIGGNGWAYFNTTSNGTTNGNVGMRYNIGSGNNANVAFHLTNRQRYSIWEHRQIGRTNERTAQMSCGENGFNQGTVLMYSSLANADVTGGVNLTNGATSWSANSDMRLKNKTGDILNALEDINKIEPIRFTWKYGPDNNPHVGVSAQSVENVVPEAIERAVDVERKREGDETEYMQVRYTELIPLSIAAIKELKSEIESLKAEIASLKSS